MFNREESATIVDGCGSALVCLFVLAQFFVKVFFVNDLMGNAFVAAIGAICLLYVCEKEGSSPLFGVIFGFASCVSLLMLVSMLYNQNTSLEDFLWVWAYSGPVAIMLFQSVDHRAFYHRILCSRCLSSCPDRNWGRQYGGIQEWFSKRYFQQCDSSGRARLLLPLEAAP